jgi:hypothetical protein
MAMRCAGQVARIGQRKNVNPNRVLVSKSEERGHLKDLRLAGKIVK